MAISEPDSNDTIIPPITPATNPENNGAPDAKAMPKHNGSATRNTENPAEKSLVAYFKVIYRISY
jgi:hypothetical protein